MRTARLPFRLIFETGTKAWASDLDLLSSSTCQRALQRRARGVGAKTCAKNARGPRSLFGVPRRSNGGFVVRHEVFYSAPHTSK